MSALDEFLETFVPRQEEADTALHNGDPEPRMQLWSRQDPVTVLGAAGVTASGWKEVSESFRWVAARFSNCESFHLEIVAAGVSGDLAYTVGYEHTKASMGTDPVRPYRLRVTHAYRREHGDWKIVHRHGDGLEAEGITAILNASEAKR